jgi:hypothetical protein
MAHSKVTCHIECNSMTLLAHIKGLEEGRRPGCGNVAWKGTFAPKDGKASSKMVRTTTFAEASAALARTKGEDNESINCKRPIKTEMNESATATWFAISSCFQVLIDDWTRIAVRLYDGAASFHPASTFMQRLTSWQAVCLRFNCLWLILGVDDLMGPLLACFWLNMHNARLKNNDFTATIPASLATCRNCSCSVSTIRGKCPSGS